MPGKNGVISADSHMTITNDKLLPHVPSKYKQVAEDFLKANTGNPIGSTGTRQETEDEHFWPALGRVGQRDPVERMKDMDADGIDAEVLYTQGDAYSMPAGNPPAIDGMAMVSFPDKEAMYPMVQAYNSALAEWIKVGKGRLNPVGIVPLTPIETAVMEINRLADLGFKAIRIQASPPKGEPAFWDKQWDPIWATAQDVGLPISLHLGGTGMEAILSIEDPTPGRALFKSLPPMFMAPVLGALILIGPLRRFPKLQIGLVEAGIGWIPYYLERMDTQWRRHGFDRRGVIDELPSNLWRRHFHATFEDDHAGVQLVDVLGPETVMWASDYPHPDCTWPNSGKIIDEHFKGLKPELKQMIINDNAARIYNLN